jgi:hypothetical protein
VRRPPDQTQALEPVDQVGHARAVNLQSRPHLAQRQRPATAQEQQHQRLISRERQLERLEEHVQTRDQDLLHAHDRRHRLHSRHRRCAPMSVPQTARLGDRVEIKRRRTQDATATGHGGEHAIYQDPPAIAAWLPSSGHPSKLDGYPGQPLRQLSMRPMRPVRRADWL